MYVTLEPCSHHGRTPPCAEAIVASGIRHVVCAIEDPNPEICGRGVAALRAAGIAVDLGIAAEEARWMAAGHILRMTRGRPFVQLKMAVSGDGLIAPGDGAPRWVTGTQVRTYAHLLRARVDAILVGRKTVADDDPFLTCRLPGLEARSPHRVVLDSGFRTPPASKLVRGAAEVPVTIFGALDRTPPPFGPGVATRQVPRDAKGGLDLVAVLAALKEMGLTRLMVEGGPTVARAFLDADLVDEAVIACGTKPLGAEGRLPLLDRGVEEFYDDARWYQVEDRMIGEDRLTAYRRRDRFARDGTA
jgi:diaminohydroxyphosphoribosylaminopyrimidine deaminase/5-amino-6-(5-phosphoribosylamino)uracil reductase